MKSRKFTRTCVVAIGDSNDWHTGLLGHSNVLNVVGDEEAVLSREALVALNGPDKETRVRGFDRNAGAAGHERDGGVADRESEPAEEVTPGDPHGLEGKLGVHPRQGRAGGAADAREVIDQRCLMCHGDQVQMKNIRLDSEQAIEQHAQQIYQQVVVTRQMPMNNASGITEAERQLLKRWFEGR